MGGLAINLWVLAGWGWMSLSVGLVEPIIILLGPYEQLMLPGILAYGAPIAAYFGLAA